MPKTNITTFSVSQSLKSGMVGAGNYPALSDLQSFYTAQNSLWVAIGIAEGGFIRCIGNTSDFTDLFSPDDQDAIRAWSMHELTGWFVSNYAYDNYVSTQQGANFTVSFTVEAVPFSGTANREVDAFADAIIDLLASPQALAAAIKPKSAGANTLSVKESITAKKSLKNKLNIKF